MKCTVCCDECGGLVEGFVSLQDGYTVGFYMRGWVVVPNRGKQDDIWPDGKNILCDYCMQSGPKYQAVYGLNFVERNARTVPPMKPAPARLPHDDEIVRSYDDLRLFLTTGEWPKT